MDDRHHQRHIERLIGDFKARQTAAKMSNKDAGEESEKLRQGTGAEQQATTELKQSNTQQRKSTGAPIPPSTKTTEQQRLTSKIKKSNIAHTSVVANAAAWPSRYCLILSTLLSTCRRENSVHDESDIASTSATRFIPHTQHATRSCILNA